MAQGGLAVDGPAATESEQRRKHRHAGARIIAGNGRAAIGRGRRCYDSRGLLGGERLALGIRLLALLLAAARRCAGTVSGRVELVEKGGRRATDLSDVVVYVDGAKAKAKPARVHRWRMKGKAFRPRVAVVPVGGTVDFPNEDPIFHNVFSVSGENRFDLELYKRPKSGSWTFQHPGVVRVYCNIHPQMSAVVLVRDNPYFAKAARRRLLHDRGRARRAVRAQGLARARPASASQEIAVPAHGRGRPRRLMPWTPRSFKRVPHKNKFGKDYSTDEKY